jgi:prolipoprotein diacylglyceryltransferase
MFPGATTVYKLMYVVGFAIMMVINLKTHKKYRLTTKNTIIITLITYVAGVTGALIMGHAYTALMTAKGFTVDSNVAIFGAVVFTPLFMTVASLILKQDWRRVIDMLAPGIFIILACAKFGCFCSGCCHGIECSFGVMSPVIHVTVFPIQIVEVFFMCFIIAFSFWYALKSKHYVKGAVYPATTILYCFMRFFAEFLRYYEKPEQRDILFNMTFWQLCCVGVAITCAVWLIIVNSKKVKALDFAKTEKEAEEDAEAEKQARRERAKKRREKQKRK